MARGPLDGLTLYRFAHISRQESAGGVEAYLAGANRLLLKRSSVRIIQTYLTADTNDVVPQEEPYGRGQIVWVPSHLIPPRGRLHRLRHFVKSRVRPLAAALAVDHGVLERVLTAERVDLAVFHWLSRDGQALLARFAGVGIPHVFLNHFNNAMLLRGELQTMLNGAVLVGGVTGCGVPPRFEGRFRSLSDGIDLGFFSPDLARSHRAGTTLTILLPSRVSEEKGHLDLVRTLPQLAERRIDARLVFAGRTASQKFRRRLERVVRDRGFEARVLFAGELDTHRMRQCFADADVVVLPSATEGLPRVLLEAQAMGVPVVAYDVGGVREAFEDGGSGILVPPRDIDALGTALRRLLTDAPLRAAMGENGRRFVEHRFSYQGLAERHESFYLEALGNEEADATRRSLESARRCDHPSTLTGQPAGGA